MEVSEQIEKFKEFIDLHYKEELQNLIRKDRKSLIIDFNLLSKFDPELSEILLYDPEEIIRAAEIALEHFDLPSGLNMHVRVKNLPKTQQFKIRDLRSKDINKLIGFEAIVRQASDVRPQVTSAKFECPSCGNTISILQLETKFREPTRCSCGRRGKFRLVSKELVDAQHLKVEEAPESLEGGEQPKRLSIFLKDDLVEPKMEKHTTPGSKIKIIGILKEIPIQLTSGAQSTRYDLVMDAIHVEPAEEDFSEIEINKEDEQLIKDLAKDPRIYEKLTNSIAPSIYGHEDVKEALVLQLMGGVKKEREDGTRTRGDMHILLVGDPGSGKSQLLQFISKCAPKARFISGKGASATGLTASVVKDEFLRGWALEAGALVLANKGIACLDELDKISQEDTSALHEALEQQTVTISKANIQATLRAETTVLAAANPKHGRFDPYAPISSQINMAPTLINRFDLIFPIKDIPNPERDAKIASHVLELQQKPDSLVPELSPEILRKYILYVKQKIFPVLTDGAIQEIKSFYVSLRNTTQKGDEAIRPIPISARQLEAIVRLAEGVARIRLSNKITVKDAKRAINLLRHCLMQVGVDPETGQIDIDRISWTPASVRGKIMSVKEIINLLEQKVGKQIPIEDILVEATDRGIKEEEAKEALDKLKRSGDIFEPRQNVIQKI